RFMLMPILAAIELFECAEHLRRRRAVTTCARRRVTRGKGGGNLLSHATRSILICDNSIHSQNGTAIRAKEKSLPGPIVVELLSTHATKPSGTFGGFSARNSSILSTKKTASCVRHSMR